MNLDAMPATASTVPETGRTLVATTKTRQQRLQEEAKDVGIMGEEEEDEDEESPGKVLCSQRYSTPR